MTDAPLWIPSADHVAATQLDAFRERAQQSNGQHLPDSTALHDWSVESPADFWEQVWAEGIVGDRGSGSAFRPGTTLATDQFFAGARLSYAENLLAGAQRGSGDVNRVAMTFIREDDVRRTLTWAQLEQQATAFSNFLRSHGVVPGDRVAAWLPNSPEAVVTMLAASMIGAVFTSTSPDFGVAGVLDRFGQVAPKVLVVTDGYVYAGKQRRLLERVSDVVAGLPSLTSVVVVEELADAPDLRSIPRSGTWSAAITEGEPGKAQFVRLPFDAPSFILYSSGTTGAPKCIVHKGGGLILKHAVEHRLHCDIRSNDVVFYFTTCGWMMWNWLVSALATGSSLVLYDGSPFHPGPERLWTLVDELQITLFGTSAKYLDAARKAGLRPITTHKLESLRTITSTGSPLTVEGFQYVYDDIKRDVHLASISGGTDICGCFVAGDPTRPVFAGQIQGPGFGMAVDIFDDGGTSLKTAPGARGELVCTNSFPSMPVAFWDDPGDVKYRAAYFERFPGVWAHGDFASWTKELGIVIHGRSDATLNAGGVRIGTAEIYRQVERLSEVVEALAIGQEWDDDTRIVLFVKLRQGQDLDEQLVSSIKGRLREHCSPRHVPSKIIAVDDLPRTRSNKLAELAVADVVHGRPVRNSEALANPESLASFSDLVELSY